MTNFHTTVGTRWLKPSVGLSLLCLVAPSLQYTHFSPDSCVIIPVPDMYGVGVRIGNYFYFDAIDIALLAKQEEPIRDGAKALNIVNAAVIIILMRNSSQWSYSLFERLLLYPMFISPFLGTLVLFQKGAHLTVGFFGFVIGIFSAVQPWIYWTRQYQGSKYGCDPRYWFFVYFHMYHDRWITAFKIVSVIMCLASVALLIFSISLISIALTGFSPLQNPRGKVEEPKSRLREARGKIWPWDYGGLVLFFGFMVVLITENTLAGNEIAFSDATLNSTSPLIPFFVGFLNLITSLYSCFVDVGDEEKPTKGHCAYNPLDLGSSTRLFDIRGRASPPNSHVNIPPPAASGAYYSRRSASYSLSV